MKILLLAGEESGELYARKLRARLSGHEIRGYADYGFQISDLAVMGIEQILAKLFFFIRVKRTMERAIREWKPDVVCTIDYPGMNLKLAAYAKRQGCRTVHVVCPQVWAWKRGRIPLIEATFNDLCCFFPFEPALFKPGFASFVGHPLVEEFEAEEAARAGQPKSATTQLTLAVLPGSRLGEIEKILPTLLGAVRQLRQEGIRFAVEIPAASPRAEAGIRRVLAQFGSDAADLRILSGGARDLLRRADCAVVASGTATLEAALARCPTVLVYRVGWFFAIVARHVIKGVRHLGLANVIWEKCTGGADESAAPMPELLQGNLTVPAVCRELRPLLTDSAARAAAKARLDAVMGYFHSSGGDAIGRIAAVITKTA